LDIVPVDDLSKCLNINNNVVTYGIFNNKVYINLTELCKAGDKKYSHWRSLDTTERFIQLLSQEAGIPASSLTHEIKGKNKIQGMWGHPQVAIDIAYWVSPEFKIKVTNWIYELALFGKVELGKKNLLKLLI